MNPRPDDRSRFRPGGIIYVQKGETLQQALRRLYMSGGGISGPEPTLTNTPRPGDTPEQAAARYRPRDPLLQERQKTHGSFKTNANISQELKALFHKNGADRFLMVHREALDMIALKLSRILSGQANFKDHWDDIAGYAKLGSEACE